MSAQRVPGRTLQALGLRRKQAAQWSAKGRLTQIDSKLDSMLGNVGALSSQITCLDNKVDALVAFERNNVKLGLP